MEAISPTLNFFRHSSIYGGRQFTSIDQGWVGWFIKQAIVQKNAIL